MSGIKNPMVSAISASAFPITGLSQATKQALKLFVPSPKTCYSDTARTTRTPLDGSVALMDETSQKLNSNVLLNPTISGAVVGTPGTQPTLWSTQSTASGLTREIVAIGTEVVLGTTMNYIDVKFSGTTTSSGIIILDPSPVSGTRALVGEQWCASVYARLAPSNTGSISGFQLNMMMPEVSSGGGILNTNALTSLSGITSTYQRYPVQRVFTDSSIAYTSLIIRSNTIASGTAINFTIRLAGPQLEKGVSSPTAFNTRTIALQATAGWQPKLRKGAKNWLLNSSFANVVVGTPGTGPTPNYGAASGITSSIVSKGTESYNGNTISYTDWRIFGTATASGDCLFDQSIFGQIPAALGQNWTNSCYIKLIAGSIPVRGSSRGFVYLHERTSAGVINKTTLSTSFDTVGSTYTQYVASRAVTVASTAYTTFGVSYGVSSGETIDFTIRVAAPQQELGTSVSKWASSSGSPASNGVGQWWLDFDGVQTSLTYNTIIVSNTSTQSFSACASVSNTYVTGSTVFSLVTANSVSGARSAILCYNPTPLQGYKDSSGVLGYVTQPSPSTPYSFTVMSVRRNGTEVKGKTNNLTPTYTTQTFGSFDCDTTYIGSNSRSNFLNGGIYGIAFGDNIAPSDSTMLSIEKYLGKLIGVGV